MTILSSQQIEQCDAYGVGSDNFVGYLCRLGDINFQSTTVRTVRTVRTVQTASN